MPFRLPSLFTVLAFGWAVTAGAADWPQWRGPDRDDVSKETGLLKTLAGRRPEPPVDLPQRRRRLLRPRRRRCDALLDGRGRQDGISLRPGYENAQEGMERRDRAGVQGRPRRRPARHADGGRRFRLRPWRPGRAGLRRCRQRRRGLAQEPAKPISAARCGPNGATANRRWWTATWSSARPAARTARWPRWTRRPARSAGAARTGPTRPLTRPWSRRKWAASGMVVQMTGESVAGVAADDGRLLWRFRRSGPTAPVPTPIVDGDRVYVTFRLRGRLRAVAADRQGQRRALRRGPQEQEPRQPSRRRPSGRRMRLRLRRQQGPRLPGLPDDGRRLGAEGLRCALGQGT